MVDEAIVARRVLALNEALLHLSSRAAGCTADGLRGDPMLRAAVERWIQTGVEACIDLAYHVIAARGWTPPDSARDAFLSLAAHGVVPAELAARLGRSVGMRNVLVHEYTAVDLDAVALAVQHGLSDLRQFGAAMGALLDRDD